jgi:tripartite-type tricarboxylate transporter receptor subunit TctC
MKKISVVLAGAMIGFLVLGVSPSTLFAQQNAGFPEKGRIISLIVPFAAGGSVDISARLLAPLLEKDLGTTVQVVNKPGAGSQLGINSMVRAKPDGYTLAYTLLPLTVSTYLNPQLKASFGRKDMQPLAMHTSDPQYVTVVTNSQYKTLTELIDAAKAKPEKITTSATGIYSPEHLAILQFQKAAGVKFSIVFFDGGALQTTALLGGHIDFQLSTLGNFTSAYKNGQVRFLGAMARENETLLPGVKTLESQGYKMYSYVSRGISVPAGTPAPVMGVLSGAIKKAMESDEHKKSIKEMNMTLHYMSPQKMAEFWDEVEQQVKPLLLLELSK